MTYKLRSKPFAAHQTDAIAWLAERGGGAVFLPMGTGKSYITLAWLSTVSGKKLIVAPLSVLRSWETQIRDHTTASYTVAVGTRAERKEALRSNAEIVLINYDYFSRVEKGFERDFYDFRSVVLDESTRIKNPRAKRTANIIRAFKRIKRKAILTGNPCPKGYEDLFSQWLFLDGGEVLGGNYFHFLRRYFNPIEFGGGRRTWSISRPGAKKLADRIAGHYFHRKKEDCVDLPPKVYERRHYVFAGTQADHYRRLVTEWLTEAGGKEKVTNNALSRDIALRQVCSGFLMVEDSVETFDTAKDDLLIETLEEADGQQAVVWFWFRHERRRLCELLEKHRIPYVFVDGTVGRDDRNEALAAFERGDVRVILAQQQTLAYGVNELASCTLAIYYGHTYDYDLRSQSEDRTSRIGSTASCTYVDLVAEKSIEDAILQVLAKKQNMSEAMIKEEIKMIIGGWR